MKILFTGVYSCYHGGLECFAERTAKALTEHGHTVDIVGDVPSVLADYDFVLIQKMPPTIQDLRRLKEKYGEKLHFFAHDHDIYCLRRHYYDPFHRNCNRTYSFFPCRLCAMVTRPQWVLRALTRDMHGFAREMREVKTYTPSSYMRDNLIKWGFTPERIRVVNPYFAKAEISHTDWMPNKALRMLFLGQLIAGKGCAVLLEALKLMKIPCELTVVGTGRDEAKLRAAAPSNVRFEGWQNDPYRYFKTTDVYVFTSLWNEPFGMVGAEAQNHAIPVVAFNGGGVCEWLRPGETGFLTESKSPEDLAAALTKIADPELLAKFSANSFKFAQGLYDPEAFIKRLLDF